MAPLVEHHYYGRRGSPWKPEPLTTDTRCLRRVAGAGRGAVPCGREVKPQLHRPGICTKIRRMLTATTIADLRRLVAGARQEGKRIGFVPTMGCLHEGHLALMREAKKRDDMVVVSIFVNPTQFGPGEDYERYPRDLAQDTRLAEGVGVEVIFAPGVDEMYPPGNATYVEVTGTLVAGLCGPHRPGHFRGVATVVAKLLVVVSPDRAYFGEKDYQQLQVIRRMVTDLALPVEIVPVPTVREADGLAMSSRNRYLSPAERAAAPTLYRALLAAREVVAAGERSGRAITAAARCVLAQAPEFRLQYLELVDAETLSPLDSLDRPAVLAAAAYLGDTRLIDNIRLLPA